MDYKKDVYWKNIQKFLPPENRLNPGEEPQEYFLDFNGIRMHIDHYSASAPKARILLFHGVGGNGRLLSFIALPLNRLGYEVICPDLPLYGCTEYEGVISYHHWVDLSAQLVRHFMKDGLPVFLFGLSAGGMLAYQTAALCPGVAGVLATCLLDQRNRAITLKTASNPVLAVAGNFFISLTRAFTGSIRVPMKMIANMKAIANNPELAEVLMKDKRSSGARVPLAFVHSMLNPVIAAEPEAFTLCPFLLVHPEDDRWTEVGLSRYFFDRLACEKELHLLAGAGHFPVESEGLKQLESLCSQFIQKHRGLN